MLGSSQQELEKADAITKTDTRTAIDIYSRLIKNESETDDVRTTAILKLGSIYADLKQGQELSDLVKHILPLLSKVAKARAAKIVRILFDQASSIPNNTDRLIELCNEIIPWCKEGKRTFLLQRIEGKLCHFLWEKGQYQKALEILGKLLYEIKRLDDKALLVELQLTEARIHHSLENIPKAKAALTSVKTASTSIYVTPLLQAEIDMMSGIISSEEKDYNTAYSYFYEAFEGFGSIKNEKAGLALKYMLLTKIMQRNPDEVFSLANSANAADYQSRDIDAMKEVARANKDQSLIQFEKSLQQYTAELRNDPIIRNHTQALYSLLFEENLKKIIEPYSEVQIDHIARTIGLPIDKVLQKLSEMILDEKVDGTLDQGRGCLIVFSTMPIDKTFDYSLETVKNLNGVVDALYEKIQKLKAI